MHILVQRVIPHFGVSRALEPKPKSLISESLSGLANDLGLRKLLLLFMELERASGSGEAMRTRSWFEVRDLGYIVAGVQFGGGREGLVGAIDIICRDLLSIEAFLDEVVVGVGIRLGE